MKCTYVNKHNLSLKYKLISTIICQMLKKKTKQTNSPSILGLRVFVHLKIGETRRIKENESGSSDQHKHTSVVY